MKWLVLLLAMMLLFQLLFYMYAPANVRAAPSLAPLVLYDGALNTTPDNQGFSYLTNPLARPSARQSVEKGVTTLDTTPAKSDSAGYFARQVSNLNRTAGYTVSFTVQIVAEDHAGSDKNGDGVGDRAGFSTIVLSSDNKGVEISFWTDKIWVQDDGARLFIQAEGKNFNTTSGLIRYDLTIRGEGYSLQANGNQLLRGALRDYSSFGWPYNVANFFFLGDDTSSASAKFKLAAASLNTEVQTAPTPNPVAQIAPTVNAGNTSARATPTAIAKPTVTSANSQISPTNVNSTFTTPAQTVRRLISLVAQGFQQIST